MEKSKIREVLDLIDKYLQNEFEGKDDQKHKLWENFYINSQIKARKDGKKDYSLNEHVEAMVYAMLSSQTEWDKIEGTKLELEKLFCKVDGDGFDAEQLTKRLNELTPEGFNEKLKELKCGSQSRLEQMRVLRDNIILLKRIEEEHGSIDAFYAAELKKTPVKLGDHPYKHLIKCLSDSGSKYKLQQMGVSLVAEYLRNIGHNISKPDVHVVRILGRWGELDGYSEDEDVTDTMKLKAMKVISSKYAGDENSGRSEAEVDYLLWAFCANKYGEVCRKEKPECGECPIRDYCNYWKMHN